MWKGSKNAVARWVLLALLCAVISAARELVSARAGRSGKYRLVTNPDRFATPWLSGLPPLPEEYSPDGSAWRNSMAICSTMKDENITDVREWLTYHRWLGVEHVFLTDNGSDDGDFLIKQLASEFPASFLTIQSEPTPRAQMMVFSDCAEDQRTNFNWMGFFDVDEYLIIRRSQNKDLAAFLDQFKYKPGIAVHWVWVGPSGYRHRPASGGVLPYYGMCSSTPSTHFKTIANMWFIEGSDVHPHNFQFRDGKVVVNENMVDYPLTWKALPKSKKQGYSDSACIDLAPSQERDTHCFRTAAATAPQDIATVDKVGLYHYATKSLEDFAAKMQRGSGMSMATKKLGYFEDIATRCVNRGWVNTHVQAPCKGWRSIGVPTWCYY